MNLKNNLFATTLLPVSLSTASPLARADARRQTMSNSISTLLTRNLQDVFGENDPSRRRAAIDEIWAEDGVFYDSQNGRPPWPRRD
jgi:hypothetical protein